MKHKSKCELPVESFWTVDVHRKGEGSLDTRSAVLECFSEMSIFGHEYTTL